MNLLSRPALTLLLMVTVANAAASEQLPIQTYTLDNGLTLVVSEDHSTPTFALSIVYHVGFRLEPKGRTGFAHLFEHFMFEGSPTVPKGSFARIILGGGGELNGQTRPDYTEFTSRAPTSALKPVLWLEADRMRHLDFSDDNLSNQKEVVKEEIRVNVKNKPYGVFYWTDLNALAFDKWENAHDGYGSFVDLDQAGIDGAESFHHRYYAPNNAVIAISGDVDGEQVHALVDKYFGDIPRVELPPRADVSESLNDKERFKQEFDALISAPALTIGWKMPLPDSPDYYPLAVLSEVLLGGTAGLLHQKMVKQERTMLSIAGGMGWPLGNSLTYAGPSLLVLYGIYKPGSEARQNVDQIQSVIDNLAQHPIDEARLRAIQTKMVADFYTLLAPNLSRAQYLGTAQLLHGDAQELNRYPERVRQVTTADLQRVAGNYLSVANRSWIDRKVAQAAQPEQSQ